MIRIIRQTLEKGRCERPHGLALEALLDLELEIAAQQAKIEAMRARLTKLQEPEGQREERVADWLRERGYVVVRGN